MSIIRVKHWHEIDEWPWKNFEPWELACRSDGSLVVSWRFMEQLQGLRKLFDKPMHITSGYRTDEHNEDIRGKKGSFHLDRPERGIEGALGVDVAATDGPYRGELFARAWTAGWSIGWNAKRGFLHLDRRLDIGWRQTTFDY